MKNPLGIDFLSVFSLPPVEFVTLAADLGCRHISSGLTGMPYTPYGYAPFSLRDDAALRAEMIAAMRDRDVSIALGEGFIVRPGREAQDLAGDLDVMHALGCRRINTLSMDPDLGRSLDEFGALAELAGERGMELTLELCPFMTITDLDMALAALAHVGRPDFKLLLDTMHLGRSGATVEQVAAIAPALIGYAQVSDAPLVGEAGYGEEAMFERMMPGEGELPLRGYLAALPPGIVVGLELPQRSKAEAGVGQRERVGACLDATRRLMA